MIIVNTSLGDKKPKDSSVDPDNMIQVGADLKHVNESATQICHGHMPETPSVCNTTHVQEVIEYKSSIPTTLDHDCNNTVAISDEPLKLIKLETKKKESDNTSCSQAESENFDVHMSSSENYRLEADATNVDVVAVSVMSEYDESCGDSDLISVSVSDPVFTLLQQELIQSQSPHDAPTEKCRKTFRIKCPLPEKSVKPHICGYKGGILTSSDGGIKIMVPEGAIHDGNQVIICIGTDLYAPFVLPSQRQTDLVSPYYWIGIVGSYYFQQSIQVEFEYYGACDTSHYQLLSCEDDDESYTMRPVHYDLSFKVQDNISLCSFQTYHFCSYCLLHGCTDPVIKKIGAYYLKPDNFQYLTYFFTVQIWFTIPISHCLETNKKYYEKKHMKVDLSYIFNVSCEKNSKSFFTLKYDELIDGWIMDSSLSTEIHAKEVNFYNSYTNAADLQASEESSSFPPRFIINVIKRSKCNKDLNQNINVILYNEEGIPSKHIPFKLFVSVSALAIRNLSYAPKENVMPSIDSHHCDENKPELKDLQLYYKYISTKWKEIALQLEIDEDSTCTIDTDYDRTTDRCFYMFKKWLEITPSPCWCHFIQALFVCELYDVAEKAKKHIKKTHDDSSASASPELSDEDDMHQLVRFLKDVPEDKLNCFITFLLPKKSAIEVIKGMTSSGEDSMKKVCKIFFQQKDASRIKIHQALKSGYQM